MNIASWVQIINNWRQPRYTIVGGSVSQLLYSLTAQSIIRWLLVLTGMSHEMEKSTSIWGQNTHENILHDVTYSHTCVPVHACCASVFLCILNTNQVLREVQTKGLWCLSLSSYHCWCLFACTSEFSKFKKMNIYHFYAQKKYGEKSYFWHIVAFF